MFTNIGTEPLIIIYAYHSSGSGVTSFSREPVLPGERGVIDVVRTTKDRSVGKFSSTIRVKSNALSSFVNLQDKGEIIYPWTTLEVDCKEKNIGELEFGNVDTVQCFVSNTGDNELHIEFYWRNYPETDLLQCKIQPLDTIQKDYKITLLIKNVYGNTGQFERNLIFTCNTHDTLTFKIKGEFTGSPTKRIIYEGDEENYNIFFYDKGKLIKRQKFSHNGRMTCEDFFEASYCTRSVNCVINHEYFYRNGILTDIKKIDIDE
ncbi:DUF1573 domain-containing protein [Bacteroidales bacterium OttesenSCG-928-B11]|nr:DUF1573 domain-containing protein [Bacteroidales bacterium OttesenSCG-928-B11]